MQNVSRECDADDGWGTHLGSNKFRLLFLLHEHWAVEFIFLVPQDHLLCANDVCFLNKSIEGFCNAWSRLISRINLTLWINRHKVVLDGIARSHFVVRHAPIRGEGARQGPVTWFNAQLFALRGRESSWVYRLRCLVVKDIFFLNRTKEIAVENLWEGFTIRIHFDDINNVRALGSRHTLERLVE